MAAVTLNSTSIQVTLQSLPSQFAHGILKGYLMTYQRVDQHQSAVERLLAVNQTVVQLNDLDEFTNYSIQALAFTRKGQGPSSPPFHIRTDEDGTLVILTCIASRMTPPPHMTPLPLSMGGTPVWGSGKKLHEKIMKIRIAK